jgi:hypothetical protein
MRVTAILLVALAAACGGGTQHSQVQEVPIDQGGGGGGSSSLPPDEVGDAGGVNSVALPDGGPPPGVGPQPLEGSGQTDAGGDSTASAGAFVHRPNGLTEKECTDMVLTFAKASAREKHNPTPTAADLGKDPIFSQMVVDCGASTTKKQQKCAMRVQTSAAWKKCME